MSEFPAQSCEMVAAAQAANTLITTNKQTNLVWPEKPRKRDFDG